MSTGEQAAQDRDTAGTTHRGARRVESDVDEQLVEADLLVEEVSIDGMCGVY